MIGLASMSFTSDIKALVWMDNLETLKEALFQLIGHT